MNFISVSWLLLAAHTAKQGQKTKRLLNLTKYQISKSRAYWKALLTWLLWWTTQSEAGSEDSERVGSCSSTNWHAHNHVGESSA